MAEDGIDIVKRALDAWERQNGPLPAPPPVPRDFVPCNFCGGGGAWSGGGCMACYAKRRQREKELNEEYDSQFPDGPKPFFTAALHNPEQMEQAKRGVIGQEAIEKAFGPGGGGMEEILRNAEAEMAKRRDPEQE
jgi:hypothetical protein